MTWFKYFIVFLPFGIAAQRSSEKAYLEKIADSLTFVTDVPYSCSDTVFSNYSEGCGDRFFWKAVTEGKKMVPSLINKLADTTLTKAPVPNFGGYYTVADVAYSAMQQIIANIPTFDLLGVAYDSSECGYCAYWNYLRADFDHRKDFQKEVRKWEERLGGRWVDSLNVPNCDCAFPHPNGGYYIWEYTLYDYTGYGFHLEYSYLTAHSIGFGANFISESFRYKIGGRRLNYTVDGTVTGLFYNHISALGQRIDLGLNIEETSPDFHLFFEHNDKNDFRIGGKVGVSFNNFFYIHYRYSYPLTSYENPFISRHGVVLTFKLNQVPFSNLFQP